MRTRFGLLLALITMVIFGSGAFVMSAQADKPSAPPGHVEQTDLPEHNNEGPPGCEPSGNKPKKCETEASSPTASPSPSVTPSPTDKPTKTPTESPSQTPTKEPSEAPSELPTAPIPSEVPQPPAPPTDGDNVPPSGGGDGGDRPHDRGPGGDGGELTPTGEVTTVLPNTGAAKTAVMVGTSLLLIFAGSVFLRRAGRAWGSTS